MNDRKRGAVPPALKEFLAELEDLLEILSQDLISLEGLHKNGQEDPDLINSIFRSVHTIKGLSGMLSLNDVGSLAHVLEDLLDSIRLGKVILNDEVIGVLFKGLELLNKYAKAIGSGNRKVQSLKPFLEQVKSTIASSRESSPVGTMEELDLDRGIIKTLTEYEEHRLKENMKGGKSLYIVHRCFSFENFDNELNELLALLKKEGEVISTLPSSSPEDTNKISFDLLWATSPEIEDIYNKFDLSPTDLKSISYQKPIVQEKEMISSTLRSLSETVRVDIKRLDNLMNIVGELVIYKTQLNEISREIAASEGMKPVTMSLSKTVKALERALNALQGGVIEARMVPVGQMFGKMHRAVRKLSSEMKKEVELQISGENTELDKLVIEDMVDPLLHLIRNAIDHGIEDPELREDTGKPRVGLIQLSAYQKGNHVVIEVEDDGSGIDMEKVKRRGIEKGLLDKNLSYDEQQILSLLFIPGFSTSEKITDISGRGVGMDIVKSNVSRLRGMIELESERNKGTKVIVTLPMTLAIIQALLVNVAGETFAIPISSVLESVKISQEDISTVEQMEVIRLRGSTLPLLRLEEVFRLSGDSKRGSINGRMNVVVVGLAEKRLGLVVDSLKGQQEIVIKALGELLKPVEGIAGATELGDRQAVLVLDIGDLVQKLTRSV